jgi:hypothetical protein
MEKMVLRLTESDLRTMIEKSIRKIISEDYDSNLSTDETSNEDSFKNNQNYTHFAVSKRSGKILNGWDYSEYNPSELRQFKKDYFDIDMQDYGFDPKSYKIVTGKYLLRQGIDPDDNSNWANNDEANADWIG